MLSALLGLIGVLVGAFLTQLFTASSEWRSRRLEAMVAVTSASARVIGAHERLYELFIGGRSPSLSDERVIRALTERSDAHNDWRISRSRLIILIADDQQLIEAIDRFEEWRKSATPWVHAYLENPDVFNHEDYRELQTKAWAGMRAARIEIGDLSRVRSQRDAQLRDRLVRRSIHRSRLIRAWRRNLGEAGHPPGVTRQRHHSIARPSARSRTHVLIAGS
jgi:hypothetical protein